MSHFFETRVENLELNNDKKKSSKASKKDKKSSRNRKRADSNSRVIESEEESCVEHNLSKKYCILHEKCSHSTDKDELQGLWKEH